ncbi:TIGR00730 family Rossman fold protein [Entomohabitans teleogrylli]|uniref:LOG family protein n=1 Tax=Entomohabitans teleogrylli TaxID=1384589 RepID=UPI00073D51EA|nr:TIGR00730 family Rossman fold protein [Entomohabitans teleogrylli]
MTAVGVFCGSSGGQLPVYMAAAREVGKALAEAGLSIVYGGGKVGLMGAVAGSAMAHGGRVTGVMPGSLVEREIAHDGLTELLVVKDMHERKTRMGELADAFIALPGGAGTLEEIFEQWTWAQLGLHHKPCAFLNVNGYYEPLREMIRRMVAEGFLHQRYADMIPFCDTIDEAIAFFRRYQAPEQKWTSAGVARHGG